MDEAAFATPYAPAAIDSSLLRDEIKLKYCEVATSPERGFHFHIGRPLARMLSYPADVVDAFPDQVVESFAGVNNPFSMGVIEPGATVVDVGSGAGFDSILAAKEVGTGGRVIGVDMTAEMRAKAASNVVLVGLANVEFRDGLAEALPLEAASADVIISNGVINLCPDKLAVYREIYRVLKPGGRLQIADVMVQKPVPQDARQAIDLWTGCIAGALLVEEYIDVVRMAGFEDIRIGSMVDVFSGSPHESDAAEFETRGVVFRAHKPLGDD